MNGQNRWVEHFETNRDHLRGIAFRMLGSLDEADDALQTAWLQTERTDLAEIKNPPGWLTTVVARVCLDMHRAGRTRGEEPLPPAADTVVESRDGTDPEDQAVMAESVGLALLVVLARLTPAERVAFVLHDLFAVPFVEIATVVGRSVVGPRSSRVAPGIGFVAWRRSTRWISPSTTPSSTRFSPPHAAATWTRW